MHPSFAHLTTVLYQMRREEEGFPCLFGGPLGADCFHTQCRLAWLAANGRPEAAERLRRNAIAFDWFHNFGRLIYDPQLHGRDRLRRSSVARLIRAIRNGRASYASATHAAGMIAAHQASL